jgi:hypothetical protein
MRRNQQKVERRYGSFVLAGDHTALRYRYDEAEQSLVPADLRDMGRDVPSRPATVLCTPQSATEQQQQQQVRCQLAGAAYETGSVPLLQRRGGGGGGPRGGHPPRGWTTML